MMVQERGLRPPPPVGASPPSRHRNVSHETFVLAPLPASLRFRAVFAHMLRFCGTEGGMRQRGEGRPGETLPIGKAHECRSSFDYAPSEESGHSYVLLVRRPRALCVLHAGESRPRFRARVE